MMSSYINVKTLFLTFKDSHQQSILSLLRER